MKDKIKQIQIRFPMPIELPDGFDLVLDTLLNIVCAKYERENLNKSMFIFTKNIKLMSHRSKEAEFDNLVYYIDIAEGKINKKSNECI